jgi:hypothetical protein
MPVISHVRILLQHPPLKFLHVWSCHHVWSCPLLLLLLLPRRLLLALGCIIGQRGVHWQSGAVAIKVDTLILVKDNLI